MGATCSSKTSVAFQRTTWRYIPEDRTLRNHCCENLKSYVNILVWSFVLHGKRLSFWIIKKLCQMHKTSYTHTGGWSNYDFWVRRGLFNIPSQHLTRGATVFDLTWIMQLEMIRKIHHESTSQSINTWRYIPEDRTLRNQRCENFKSYAELVVQKLVAIHTSDRIGTKW
jgi:hypothetical protein